MASRSARLAEVLANVGMPSSAVVSLDSEWPTWLQKFINIYNGIKHDPIRRRRTQIALVALGAVALMHQYYQSHKRAKIALVAKRKHDHMDEKTAYDTAIAARKRRPAVDALFFARLSKIMRIVIPGWRSKEASLLFGFTTLLFSRTYLSIVITELIGMNAQSLVSRKWGKLARGIRAFMLISIPAAAVNAGLKWCQRMLALQFRMRLSSHVHESYLSGVNFYRASQLGGDNKIVNADQRVTADIADWSTEVASLYSSVLKPTLDVVLFTKKLSDLLGFEGPLVMHLYFLMSAYFKKNILPGLGPLVAKESELEGNFRTAHQRVITNSEEISFLSGSKRERVIIDQALERIYHHSVVHNAVRFFINFVDQLVTKYVASVAGYCTLLVPAMLNAGFGSGLSESQMSRDYIRNSQFLGTLSGAVGDLVIAGNKLTSIAGYTARVSELLEQVNHLSTIGNRPFEVHPDDTKDGPLPESADSDKWIYSWKRRCDETSTLRREIRDQEDSGITPVIGGGKILRGDYIEFADCDIVSPDGKMLVEKLSFRVDQGRNTMVTGANGSGKSSMFRVIGQLWPLHCGTLTRPHNADVLFIPQRPYLCTGTLRDQIIYPHSYVDMQRLGVTDDDLSHLLAIVDPAQNILKQWTMDYVTDWNHAFSGGQKQRCGFARLFYHRPQFAILDECTSAVSDEVESVLYQTCRKLAITLFTVSHRPSLARFHDQVLRFHGRHGAWDLRTVTPEEQSGTKLYQLSF